MNFVTKEPINKGWSSDKKYCVTTANGTRYLLRVSDIAQHDTKQSEFNMMKQVASFGVPMCQPVEFGTCEDGVYSIQSWIDGEDAEQVMSSYSDTEQYIYGLEAGRILRKIHSISAPATQENQEIRIMDPAYECIKICTHSGLKWTFPFGKEKYTWKYTVRLLYSK